MKKLISLLLLAMASVSAAQAQTANPTMVYTDTAGTTVSDETEYDGSAPFRAEFRANPEDVGSYSARYEWRFMRSGSSEPFMRRYEENTSYEFMQSGSYSVQLFVTFYEGGDTIEYEQETPFNINIRESRLEFPNAFTPNGDGTNDVLQAKSGYESITEFRARVFSRSGKLLYEWTDISSGWDGRSGGRDVPDGAYYLYVKAKGADGRDYDIRKTINILRGYRESSGN